MIEKMVICNWYTPDEKMPEEGYFTIVTFSGKSKNTTYDHTFGVGQWMDDGLGWTIEGLPEDAEYEVLAWCDLEPYQGGQ